MYQFYQWLKQCHQFLRILSLDVVLGAVAQAYLWAYLLQVSIPKEVYLALGLSVWLIYTLDHLLDAYKIPHRAHTARHRFHQNYFYPLAVIWCLAALLGLWLAIRLPIRLWMYGGGMLCLVGLHFILSFSVNPSKNLLLFQKETRIALFYSLGVGLGAWSIGQDAIAYPKLCWGFGLVFGLAWFNLLLISYHEADTDSKDKHNSIAGDLGLIKLHNLIRRLSFALASMLCLGIFILKKEEYLVWLIFGLMWLTLELVRHFHIYFAERERYRAWSDLVFLYPYGIYFLTNGTGF